MMNWLLAVAGAIAGLFLFEKFHGLIVGSLIGWLVATVMNLRGRIDRLEQQSATSTPPCPQHDRTAGQPSHPPAEEPHFVFIPDDDGGRSQHVARTPQRPAAPQTVPRNRRPLLPEPLQWLFSSENLLVKAGVVILFFGVAFLVKYAAQRGLVPVQLRLAASSLGGFTLLFCGLGLRNRRREYALTLQGGGVGVLYITVYATFRLYGLFDPLTAFAFLAAIAAGSSLLAVYQNALSLALGGVVGGFLAPLLAPAQGNPSLLFGYYLILNFGIAAIAWTRSWRLLNLTGFVATFVVGLWWGGRYYRPHYFLPVEPFLIAFFLLYVAIAILFARLQPPGMRGAVDGTVVFGTPIAAFALQAALLRETRYGLAWSALAAGLLYLALGNGLRRRLPELSAAFTVFGCLFVTLAVPLACDGRWTSAFWAVEGAAVLWVALRQGRSAAAIFGLVLQLAAGVAFVVGLEHPAAEVAIRNANWLGMLLLALAGLISAWRLRRDPGQLAGLRLDRLLTVWGLLWWYGNQLHEIVHFAPLAQRPLWVLLFLSATAWGCHLLGRRLDWVLLAAPGFLLLPALLLAAHCSGVDHPLENGGWWGWPLALVSLWSILYRDRDRLSAAWRIPLHAGAIWLLAGLATWELFWQVQERLGRAGNWQELSLVAVPCLLLAAISFLARGGSWPCGRERVACLGVAALALAGWSWLWIIASSVSRGDAWPFQWLPLLNPLDLGGVATLAVLLGWWRSVTAVPTWETTVAPLRLPAHVLAVGGAFVWLNAALSRFFSHWRQIPYQFETLFHSSLVQTGYTLCWTFLALGAMFCACRKRLRILWLCGASLLGVVVIKLFTVDLAGSGTIGRIVSFVAVGILLLVVGWFAPVPPARVEREESRALSGES